MTVSGRIEDVRVGAMRRARHGALALLLALAAGAFADPLAARAPAAPFGIPELASSRAAPGRVDARFMGTSTLLLDDGTTQILVDGFFTRPGRIRMLLGKIRPDEGVIRRALARAGIGERLRAVLVAHSHYDHALDSATVARLTPAVLVGSRSTANIALGEGLPRHRIRVSGHGRSLHFGRFRVSLFGSLHSLPDRFPGVIEAPLTPPAHMSQYREGGSHSFLIEHDGLNILVHPGANFLAGAYRGVRADIVFLAVGQLGLRDRAFAEDYWREVVRETRARLVIPFHWDDFSQPLSRELRPPPWPIDKVRRAMAWVRDMAERDRVALGMMPVFVPVDPRVALPPPGN